MEERPIPGVKHQPVAQDGACLFHSFAVCYKQSTDKEVKARALRAEVVTHMTRHRDRYAKDWNGHGPDGTKCPSFDKYLELIAEATAFTSELEVAALGRLYDVKIVVVPKAWSTYPPVSFSTN